MTKKQILAKITALRNENNKLKAENVKQWERLLKQTEAIQAFIGRYADELAREPK